MVPRCRLFYSLKSKNQPLARWPSSRRMTELILGIVGWLENKEILVALMKSSLGVMIRSLWPSCSSPRPKMTIGVTLMIVIITTEERMRSVIVERERQLISLLDFTFTEQLLWSWPSID